MVPDEAQVHMVGDDDLSTYGDLELQLRGGTWKASNQMLPHLAEASEGQFISRERVMS